MPAPIELPARPPAPPALRAWEDFDRLSQTRPEERLAIGSAILLTILLHGALFFWVLPWLGNVVKMAPVSARAASLTTPPPRPVEYALTPATPEDQKAIRYLETNPAAPSSAPVATNNISNRDQRVAQPVPNPDGHSDLPATTGDTLNSSKIVSGDLRKPMPPAPPSSTAPPTKAVTAAPPPTAPPPEQIAMTTPSLPSNITTPTEGEGVRVSDQPGNTTAQKPADQTPPANETVPDDYKLPPGPLTPEAVAASAAAATPQARPTLEVQTHAGPIIKSTQGTHNAGIAPAVDAKFTPFGAYLQKMFEAIGSEWDIECEDYTFGVQDSGVAVVVSFIINSQGQVESAQVENSSATRGATMLCLNAIQRPAPYGVWTKEMTAELGDRQLIKVAFYYQ
jgi:hypothetical protein